MAQFITIFPISTPCRFFPVVDTTSNNYFSIGFDQKAFAQSTAYMQTPGGYEYKATFDDTITIMAHTQNNAAGANPPTLRLFNGLGEQVLVLTPYRIGTQAATNNTYTDPYTGATTQLRSTLWAFKFGTFLNPLTESGCYYLVLNNLDASGNNVDYRSEPILLYSEAPGTILVQSRYNTNRIQDRIIIDGWGGYLPQFYLRVQALLNEYAPKGIKVGYLQQEYLQQQMNAQSWRNFKFKLGASSPGVPPYLLEKADQAFNADMIFLDGKQFIYDNGTSEAGDGKAIWKTSENVQYKLIWAELNVRPAIEEPNAYVTEPVYLFTSALEGGYYGISGFSLDDGSTTVSFNPFVFYAESDEVLFLNFARNDSTTAALGGTFVRTELGEFYYINAPGEDYALVAAIDVFTKYLRFEVTPAGGLWEYDFGNQAGNRSKVLTDFGDDPWPYNLDYTVTSLFSVTETVSNTYGAATPVTVTAFHNDLPIAWKFDNVTTSIMTSGVDGQFSIITESIQIRYNDFNNASVAIPNSRCRTNLINIILIDSNIGSFEPALFRDQFPILEEILLQTNSLSVSQVDELFNTFYANGGYLMSGTRTFNTSGQTPAAPPTAASLAARTALAADGWTIITD